MFASRANQENAIYEQQTAAAAKPLNQGVKGLAPKTPANKAPKTPFKVPLNDENATLGGGKTGGKGRQGGLFGEGKSGKVDTFVTPAGPRNRAPLGNKTTNAKATAFQTPAPPTQEKPLAKQSSPRLRRAKIKVHEAEPETVEDKQEEREIEYIPPRGVPLPDYPDDWPHDRTYPQLEGKNFTRGWWSEFAPLKGDDDDSEFSDFEEKLKMVEERNRNKQHPQQVKRATPAKTTALQKTARDPLTAKTSHVSESKRAASALLQPLNSNALPSFAAPTAAARSRAPGALASKKPTGQAPSAAGNARHAVAKVASNTTMGYSKGRALSASARKPLSNVHGKKISIAKDAEQPPAQNGGGRTALDDLFVHGLSLDHDANEGLGSGIRLLDEEDDELKGFQLDPVEL